MNQNKNSVIFLAFLGLKKKRQGFVNYNTNFVPVEVRTTCVGGAPISQFYNLVSLLLFLLFQRVVVAFKGFQWLIVGKVQIVRPNIISL
jgi:hypothetical protein